MPKKENTNVKERRKTKAKAVVSTPVLEAASAAPVSSQAVVVVHPPQPPTAEQVAAEHIAAAEAAAKVAPSNVNVSDQIWNEIKDVNLNLFCLPGQTVSMYCTRIPVEPSKVYMTIKVTAVLTALEDALGKNYNFDLAGKFILVTRK